MQKCELELPSGIEWKVPRIYSDYFLRAWFWGCMATLTYP